jgi:lipopolysaccharide/colanic/teichoic acid biosynthesis glycosyltransferase
MGPTASRRVLQRFVKRGFDILFSLSVLIAFSPILAIIALAVRLTSVGPILFRQQRVGHNGLPFTIYKFRSMHVTANPYAKTPTSDDVDRRVTRVGRLLRKTGLDELPQFYNVLVGDMSVVGPRPEMEFIVQTYTPRQRRRLSMRPGITGPWQISEARREPIHENVQYDLYYIRHQSLLLDLEMIARTFLIMLRPRVYEPSTPIEAGSPPRPHISPVAVARTEQQTAEVT